MPSKTVATLSNYSFLEAKAETAWADGGTGSAVLIPYKDGDYSVMLTDGSREQEHIVGDPEAQYMVQTGRSLAGDLRVGLWPHLAATLLGWGRTRDVNGEVASKTLRWTVPGIETLKHYGLKVDRMTIEGTAEGDIDIVLGLIGKYEDDNGGSILTYSGYTVPEIPSLVGYSARVIASLNAGSTGAFTNRIKPLGVKSWSITLENQLKPGPAEEDRITPEKDGAISYLMTGRPKVSVRFVAALTTSDYGVMKRKKLYGQLKILAAHRSYPNYLTVASDAAAGTAVAISTDATSGKGFTNGDVVFADAYTTAVAHLPAVGTVTAVGANSVTIDVLDEPVKAGDHIFRAGVEILTAPFVTPTMPYQKPFGDSIDVEVNGEIFSGGDSPLSFKANDLSLP